MENVIEFGEIGGRICILHAQVMVAAKKTLDDAIEIGRLLILKKGVLSHGDFLPWIRRELPFSERAARNYLALYKNRELLKSASVADLTSAYRLIANPERKPEVISVQPDVTIEQGESSPIDPANIVDAEDDPPETHESAAQSWRPHQAQHLIDSVAPDSELQDVDIFAPQTHDAAISEISEKLAKESDTNTVDVYAPQTHTETEARAMMRNPAGTSSMAKVFVDCAITQFTKIDKADPERRKELLRARAWINDALSSEDVTNFVAFLQGAPNIRKSLNNEQ